MGIAATGGSAAPFCEGWPIYHAVHDPASGAIYAAAASDVIPLDPGHGRCMPEGRAAVWRTRDAGATWQRLDRGLPQRDAHLGVLRESLAIDSLDVPGLYFGTSTGQVFASADEGETWNEIASYLPPISSVEVAVLA